MGTNVVYKVDNYQNIFGVKIYKLALFETNLPNFGRYFVGGFKKNFGNSRLQISRNFTVDSGQWTVETRHLTVASIHV